MTTTETNRGTNERADRVIRQHVAYAVAAAAVPVPLGDILAVTAVQLDLVRSLAELHRQRYDPESGKALVAALTGVSVARIGASAFKAVPGVGTLVGGAAQLTLSGASTYAIGKVFDRHFAGGGTLRDFDVNARRDEYERHVQEGSDPP